MEYFKYSSNSFNKGNKKKGFLQNLEQHNGLYTLIGVIVSIIVMGITFYQSQQNLKVANRQLALASLQFDSSLYISNRQFEQTEKIQSDNSLESKRISRHNDSLFNFQKDFYDKQKLLLEEQVKEMKYQFDTRMELEKPELFISFNNRQTIVNKVSYEEVTIVFTNRGFRDAQNLKVAYQLIDLGKNYFCQPIHIFPSIIARHSQDSYLLNHRISPEGVSAGNIFLHVVINYTDKLTSKVIPNFWYLHVKYVEGRLQFLPASFEQRAAIKEYVGTQRMDDFIIFDNSHWKCV